MSGEGGDDGNEGERGKVVVYNREERMGKEDRERQVIMKEETRENIQGRGRQGNYYKE